MSDTAATNQAISISINEISRPFSKHLTERDNKRILFSGKFGTGKTTFLMKYFKEDDSFNVFHLFPINYQVAKNEDIFELIKFDLLTKLITKFDINFSKDKDWLLAAQYYVMNEGGDAILDLFKTLPQIGGYIKSGEKLIQFFSGLKNSINKDHTEEYISAFKNKITQNSGSIYECDSYTNYINEKLNELKGDKKNVLIIDDLDRIDPEHVFRLLNIFSSHFDNREFEGALSLNKFGFDKIIFVCDLNNLEEIFKTQYGKNSDFIGYINKFFSYRPFIFDNVGNWNKNIRHLLSGFIEWNINNDTIDEFIAEYIYMITIDFSRNKFLSARDLLGILESPFLLPHFSTSIWAQREKGVNFSEYGVVLYHYLMRIHNFNFKALTSSLVYLANINNTLFEKSDKDNFIRSIIKEQEFLNNTESVSVKISDYTVSLTSSQLTLFNKNSPSSFLNPNEINHYDFLINLINAIHQIIHHQSF